MKFVTRGDILFQSYPASLNFFREPRFGRLSPGLLVLAMPGDFRRINAQKADLVAAVQENGVTIIDFKYADKGLDRR